MGSLKQGYHNNVFMMTYCEENENDNNYNEYNRYQSSICSSQSISIKEMDDYNGPGNNNKIIPKYNEDHYNDVEDDSDSPKKGLFKQMFCLPLN